ncbi:hypothetical protein OOT46_05645 [Aquabacterium sp. A7-Y]|uniref:toxin VasX n=1 Tax=Aquabacterium sp. A7-Y TaxID=1349605 RepID=UPI00223D221E|nr:toxin VasX [Aquabacterium sp. A7-Y]MCW7537335.1 hypothetical protein [Aquabacterium sp. A7-Y]
MTTTRSCKICEHSGLPILFLYHAAVAKDPDFGPLDAHKLKSHPSSIAAVGLPDITHSRYVLRSLRPRSFLYIYHEVPPPHLLKRLDRTKAAKTVPASVASDEAHWEVFQVLTGGALVPQDHPLFGSGEAFSCDADGGSHIYTALTYRLRNAHASKGIWVAVSANQWNRKLRERIKERKAEVMHFVNVPAALSAVEVKSGTHSSGKHIFRPTGEWLEEHVADFALDNFQHGKREPRGPLAKVRGAGAALVQRMEQLSAEHPKTKGRGFAFVLPDPVGTAQALAEISLARQQQGLDYAYENRQPFGVATAIQVIRNKVHTATAEEIDGDKTKNPRFTAADLHETTGLAGTPPKPKFVEPYFHAAKLAAESGNYINCGTMSRQNFESARDIHKNLPKNATYLKLANDPARGVVIAPFDALTATKAKQTLQKMDRLHNGAEMETFLSEFNKTKEKFERLVREHNDDQAQLLPWAPLACYMRDHFDASDPNDRNCEHKPGEVYMQEAAGVLIGSGTFSPRLAEESTKLLDAQPGSDNDWLLRAMVANQKELFAAFQDEWAHGKEWFSSEDKKFDKTYDTIKGLMSDDWVTGALRARFGWLNPAGIALSFGLQAWAVAAAAYVTAELLAKSKKAQDVAAKANASLKGVVDRKLAAGKAARAAALQASVDRLKAAEAAADLRTKKCAIWADSFGGLLAAVLTGAPPSKPVLAKVQMHWTEALAVLTRLENSGKKLDVDTRQQKQHFEHLQSRWKTLPDHIRNTVITIDLRVTNADLVDAMSLPDLHEKATGATVSIITKEPGLRRVDLTVTNFANLYDDAHRYDRLKSFVTDGIKGRFAQLNDVMLGGSKRKEKIVQAAVKPNGAIDAGIDIAGKAATATKNVVLNSDALGASGHLSLGGALLQWRLHYGNAQRIDELSQKLLATPGLTPEQREVIQETIQMTKFGLWDNYAGMAGGVLELGGLIASDLRQFTWAQARPTAGKLLTGGAAAMMFAAGVSGAIGNALNAAQNFMKAASKFKQGQTGLASAYLLVTGLYTLGSGAVGASAVEIAVHWYWERKLLEGMTIRGIQRNGVFVAGRWGYGWVRGLSLTGWGLVLTLASFAVEGIVIYCDRTPLEAWIENSYFGNKPLYRDKYPNPKNWERENAALEKAFKLAHAQAAEWSNLDKATAGGKQVFPPLVPTSESGSTMLKAH